MKLLNFFPDRYLDSVEMASCSGNNDVNDFSCNEICRLCLTREGDMSPIFSRPSDVKSISIPYRIMAFTSIKVSRLLLI